MLQGLMNRRSEGFTQHYNRVLDSVRTVMSGRSSSAGFTLVELLVVVSIIAILSFTVVTNLSSVRGKARDAKITRDLSEVDKGMTLYLANAVAADIDALNSTSGSTGFSTMQTKLKAKSLIPANADVKHPLEPDKKYLFKGVKVNAATLNYFICAELEQPADAAKPFFVVENGTTYMGTNACQ